MKNRIYIFGIILVIIFTVGAIFKIEHWPGAGILLVASLSLFSLVFSPIAIIDCYKKEKKYAFVYVAGLISITINFIGAMFKIMHWPGAGILLTIAIIIPFVLFLPAYFIYVGKLSEKKIGNLVSVLFLLAYIAAMDAILALNVSRAILDDSALISNHYELLTAYYEKSPTKELIDGDSIQISHLNILSKKSDKLIEEIDALKKDLLMAASKSNREILENNNDMIAMMVYGKDNRAVSSELMIRNNKAAELKNSLNEYKRFLREITENKKSGYVDKFINTDDIEWEGDFYSWEEVHYNGTMLIWALNHLNSLEFHVRMVEAELADNIVNT